MLCQRCRMNLPARESAPMRKHPLIKLRPLNHRGCVSTKPKTLHSTCTGLALHPETPTRAANAAHSHSSRPRLIACWSRFCSFLGDRNALWQTFSSTLFSPLLTCSLGFRVSTMITVCSSQVFLVLLLQDLTFPRMQIIWSTMCQRLRVGHVWVIAEQRQAQGCDNTVTD